MVGEVNCLPVSRLETTDARCLLVPLICHLALRDASSKQLWINLSMLGPEVFLFRDREFSQFGEDV